MIEELEERNKKLLILLKENGISNNHSEVLHFSIKKDLVRNFWIGCKG